MNEKKNTQKRNTKQRQIVYEAVMARCDHPSADDIYQDVYKKDSKISKGTVYRNLNTLSESGDITHVKVPGADRYDGRLDRHYHIMCTECGRVFDVPMEYQEEYDSTISERTGFVIDKHLMLFEGICPDCQRSGK